MPVKSEFIEEIFNPFKLKLGNFFGEKLLFKPPVDEVDIVLATEYLKSERLLEAIAKTAAEWETDNLQAAASVWNKYYSSTLLPGVLAYMTLLGVGVDASLENVSIVLTDNKPQALLLHNLNNAVIYQRRFPQSIPASYPENLLVSSVADLHQVVFTNLLQRHLAFAIDRVHSLTKLSKAVMWGNAGNLCVFLYEKFAELLDEKTAVDEDRLVLLEQRNNCIIPKVNPLYKPVRYEQLTDPDLPPLVSVRRTCCLVYLLPNLTNCSDCPRLNAEERIALLKQEMAEEMDS